jgi:hypothetical protein
MSSRQRESGVREGSLWQALSGIARLLFAPATFGSRMIVTPHSNFTNA